jgi:hypothetical protein
MLRYGRRLGVVALAALAFSLPAQEVCADDQPIRKPIAWTGIGIYPRESPSMESGHAGTPLADGTEVTIACETFGESVDNGYMTTDLWDRLPDGTYLPNAFIDTGTSGYTPGVPLCNDIDNPLDLQRDIISLPGQYYAANSPTPLPIELFSHYNDKSGTPVVLDWAYFSTAPGFNDFIKSMHVGEEKIFTPNPITQTALKFSIGDFPVDKVTDNCYRIENEYDFIPDKTANQPYAGLNNNEKQGGAKNFTMYASNCYSGSVNN